MYVSHISLARSVEETSRAAYINARMSWRWVFGIWGIVGAVLIILYVILVPETRGGVILAHKARKARKAGHKGAWAIHEKLDRRSVRQILQEVVFRPASKSFLYPFASGNDFWLGDCRL
jgi:MFS family permease